MRIGTYTSIGSFVWVGSLAARMGWAGWSAWGVYLVTGVLQGCLLSMAIWFEIRDRRRRKASDDAGGTQNGHLAHGAEEDSAPSNEETPLLGNIE